MARTLRLYFHTNRNLFINPHQPTRNNHSTYEFRLPVATNI